MAGLGHLGAGGDCRAVGSRGQAGRRAAQARGISIGPADSPQIHSAAQGAQARERHRLATLALALERRTCERSAMAAPRLQPDEPAPAGTLALLASRRFGPLFWAQFLSAFNDNA